MGDRRTLPRLEDRAAFLYLERGRLRADDRGIDFEQDEDVIAIPAASLSCILLGPGTTVTHEAVKRISDVGCVLAWTGEEGVRSYAWSLGSHSVDLLHRQVGAWADPARRLQIARRLLGMRFGDDPPPGDINALLAWEGERMRLGYQDAADKVGILWEGRQTDRPWDEQDAPNRALSAAVSCLYGLAGAGCAALGLSPALGFLHSGNPRSFLFDLADLHKLSLAVPVAFRECLEGERDLAGRVRRAMRDEFRKSRWMARFAAEVEDVLA